MTNETLEIKTTNGKLFLENYKFNNCNMVLIKKSYEMQGRSKGDIPGVRYKVIKVNDQPLSRLVSGKIQKGRS